MSFHMELLMYSVPAAVLTLLFVILSSPCPKSEDQNYCQADQECSQAKNCLYLAVYHALRTPKPYLLFYFLLPIIGVIYRYWTNIRNLLYFLMPFINFARNKIEGQGNDIKWMKRSLLHHNKLEELVKMLKYKPHLVETIEGTYNVCYEQRFCIGESNGTGVFVGLSTDGTEVAVKRITLARNSSLNSELARNEKNILNSPNLVDNAHVLNYKFHWENDQYAYIITQLQEETLTQFVQWEGRSLADLQENGPTILEQILLGIQALHQIKILHLDLKPENILVNTDRKMILADFGLSRKLKQNVASLRTNMKGTEGWMAVESLPNVADDDKDDHYDDSQHAKDITVRYTTSSDIQVLGMLFYYVLTKGKHPFGKWYFDRLSNTRKGNYSLSRLTDPVATDLIKWMLNENPDERPTVEQCLKHPYIMSLDENFEFLTVVGNEPEIRCRNAENNNSHVIQDSDQEASLPPSLTTPPWSKKIDEELYNHVDDPGNKYGNTVADLLHFIRKADEHWSDKPAFAERFGTAPAYFLKVFPELPMIVHKSIRKDPKWNARVKVKKFL